MREALFELRAEGLLAQQPRRGFVVLPVTDRDLADVANLQAHVGGELAARAAVNIDRRPTARTQRNPGPARAGVRAADDIERTVRLNHEFHRAINVAAESPKLAQMMSQITRYAPESVFPTIAGWPGQSIKDHRRVMAALQHRQRAGPQSHVRPLAAGVAPLIDHLMEQGVSTTPGRHELPSPPTP